MAKKPKIIEQIPLPDKVIYYGSISGALMAIAGAYTYFGGPKPLMNTSPIVEAVEAVEEDQAASRMEPLSRYMRDDKRELYDVEQRLKAEPDNEAHLKQKVVLEETLDEMETEKEVLRKKEK